jgi:hypothetical protein
MMLARMKETWQGQWTSLTWEWKENTYDKVCLQEEYKH